MRRWICSELVRDRAKIDAWREMDAMAGRSLPVRPERNDGAASA